MSDDEFDIAGALTGADAAAPTTSAAFPLLDDPDVLPDVLPAPARKAKAGLFASFALLPQLLGTIARKGYRQPTPIQRKTLPLVLARRDVVGMARTGSGKTAAFVLPVIERLRLHRANGLRALILLPSRELAQQTHKQTKEFAKGTDLRVELITGGESLDQQFAAMSRHPDIVVATPGRFLHVQVEMRLGLDLVEMAVFDEADRLFEMGFAAQLDELLALLPPSRQTLLFLATLPAQLVEFAKAGLLNPVLVRLDAETRIPENLEMAFFATKKEERDGTLLYVLKEVAKVPEALDERMAELRKQTHFDDDDEKPEKPEKPSRKRHLPTNPSPHSTIVFVPTRHHVEYVTTLIRAAGLATLYVYGLLDQHARRRQLQRFREGLTDVMVVTDVAARGIDIPVLANVVNYSLPLSLKLFVHRVGRTARAGQRGWAYLIVGAQELPYLLDLEVFLGRKVYLSQGHTGRIPLTERLVVGLCPREAVENSQEFVNSALAARYELKTLRDVALKGEKLYFRTRSAASAESTRRARDLVVAGWDAQHCMFGESAEAAKDALLAQMALRRNKQTVFEWKGGNGETMELMKRRRKEVGRVVRKVAQRRSEGAFANPETTQVSQEPTGDLSGFEDLELVLQLFRDPSYILHTPLAQLVQDRQLLLAAGEKSSFVHAANAVAFDLNGDDGAPRLSQVMKWDAKKKRYTNTRSTDVKYVVSESGQRIPASYRAGKYDEWKKKGGNERVEREEQKRGRGMHHVKDKAPKLPDKHRDDYHKQKKKVEAAMERGVSVKGFRSKGSALQELKSAGVIRRERMEKEKRQQKNGKGKKGKRGAGGRR